MGIFSKISKVVATLGSGNDALLTKPRRLQDKALKTRNVYMQELYGLISSRDVSEEKLKKLTGCLLPCSYTHYSLSDSYPFESNETESPDFEGKFRI